VRDSCHDAPEVVYTGLMVFGIGTESWLNNQMAKHIPHPFGGTVGRNNPVTMDELA